MFDFERLIVYSKARTFNKKVHSFLKSTKLDWTTNDQLRRAALSIMLNLAEGTGRKSPADKKRFYVFSRGSTFECVAIIDYLREIDIINQHEYKDFYFDLDELSRMLYALINTPN